MSDRGREYYVKTGSLGVAGDIIAPYSVDRPAAMWRCTGGQWEYYSLVDWQWHDSPFAGDPERHGLVWIDGEEAERRAANRQYWVRYWAYYASEWEYDEGGGPESVVRRRSSPEGVLDEYFGRDNKWWRSGEIERFIFPYDTQPPLLVEITRERANDIIEEVYGVKDATSMGIERDR
ncbi:hypothetical protein [Nocardia sp. IFM 10818]